MKTWPAALINHKARLAWCMRIHEVFGLLERAGAPPPDEVYAAHADWGCKQGIVRIGMSLNSDVNFMGNKKLIDSIDAGYHFMKTAKTVEELNLAIPGWAAVLTKLYDAARGGEPNEYKQANDKNLVDDDAVAVMSGERAIEARNAPYGGPHMTSDARLAELVRRRLMDSGVFELQGNDVKGRREHLIEMYVRQVLSDEKAAGRR